ncbi:MAG: hypothetical protein M3R15_09940, partial [Acidobacteriota bacterium]|nr:hypothetical protein [Acidobacteriota bacterium]
MKNETLRAVVVTFLAVSIPHAYGESELLLKQTVEPGSQKRYGHESSIVLSNGFWAKAGSDVTATICEDCLLQTFDVESPGRQPALLYSGSHSDDSVSVDVGKNVKLPNPADYYAVNAISIREEDNQPCYIELRGRMVDLRYQTLTRRLAEFELDKCQVRPGKELLKGKVVSFSDLEGGFIRSLRVSKGTGGWGGGVDNYELKGITILPALVSASSDVTTRQLPMTFTQPNCPKETTAWEPWGPW